MTQDAVAQFTVTPLGDDRTPGVAVTNLDPAAISHPQVAARLRALWQEHGVIVFRGLSGAETHLELSRVFGTLTAHPAGKTSHNAVYPELSDIGYSGEDGNIVEIGGKHVAHYLPWHSDLVYFAEINRGGILRAIEPSREGGLTGFVDKAAAWKSLPERLKARAEGLWATYWGDFRMESCHYAKGATTVRQSASATNLISRRHQFPVVAHPIVWQRPETGETMLSLSPWFLTGIVAMDEAEAWPLLDELVAHVSDDAHAYYHRWEPEDMVLWDNWRMLHCSTGVPVDDRRIMQRTTIMGDYGLGRVIKATAESDTMERISV